MLLDGLFVPLTAPFYRDGALYLRKLEHNVDRLSRTPAAGFVAFAQHGEGHALTTDELKQSLASIRAAAAPEKVLLAGLPVSSVVAALDLAGVAAANAFDAVIAGLPASFSQLANGYDRNLMAWFGTIADRSPLPVVLASGAGDSPLSLHDAARLATHPNVIGMVDFAATPERLAALMRATTGVQREVTVTPVFAAVTNRMLAASAPRLDGAFLSAESLASGSSMTVTAAAVTPAAPPVKTRTKTVGFQIIAANGGDMISLLEAKAAAVLPALAACAPQACHEVLAAFRDGDPDLALLKQYRLAAAQAMVEELGVSAVKYASDLNGYYGGAPRLPLLPLDAAQKRRVEEAFHELRN